MSLLPIYLYNNPVLKQKTDPIGDITNDLRSFVEDMYTTMHASDGIGLAANQVGRSLSVTVIDITDTDEHNAPPKFVMINPKILYYSDNEVEMEEGCLSLPQFREVVFRPELVQVQYFDIDMKEHVKEAGGLLARVMQHEIDHLNGIYFFERLSPIRKTLAQRKLRKIASGDAAANYFTVDSEGNLKQPTAVSEKDENN